MANVGKIWATFYSNIRSHWLKRPQFDSHEWPNCIEDFTAIPNAGLELLASPSSYGRRFMFVRSWVWIPAPDTRWLILQIYLLQNCIRTDHLEIYFKVQQAPISFNPFYFSLVKSSFALSLTYVVWRAVDGSLFPFKAAARATNPASRNRKKTFVLQNNVLPQMIILLQSFVCLVACHWNPNDANLWSIGNYMKHHRGVLVVTRHSWCRKILLNYVCKTQIYLHM